MTAALRAPDLRLPEGARLIHVGPHKTGTTALQAALWNARPALLARGVRHVGRSRNPSPAVRAVVGQNSPYGNRPPPIGDWEALVREFRRAGESRVVVSSEFFAWAAPDAIRRIVDDLDPARVHVAVTVRALVRVIPSMWQQNVQQGTVTPFEDWLEGLLGRPTEAASRAFWTLERHDELIDRWAAVVGPERVTAVVVDDRDHGAVLRAFEALLGLPAGTLVAVSDLANRSLTRPEAEAVRAFNVAFKAEGLPRDLHARTMRFGAAQVMKRRTPPPDEPGVRIPPAELPRVAEIQGGIVANLAASGVRIIGDLAKLTAANGTPAATEAPPVAVPPEVAATMAMGLLEVTGTIRQAAITRGPFRFAEPVEVVRVPTYQLLGAIGSRAWRAVVGRLLLRRPAVVAEPEAGDED